MVGIFDATFGMHAGPTMATAPQPQGGYNISGVTVYNTRGPMKKTELKHLLCPLCNKCVKDPVQVIVCGHRYCKGCLDHYISDKYVSKLRGRLSHLCHVSTLVYQITYIFQQK